MASILCNNGAGVIGWRDENNTAGLWKLCTNGSNAYWHYNQSSGWWYLFNAGGTIGWRQKWFTVLLGSLPIGSIVKFNVKGALKNFIVVQHGRPAASYDASFDGGTILFSEATFDTRYSWWPNATDTVWMYWGSNMLCYALEREYLDNMDAALRQHVKTVYIPCGHATASGTVGVQLMPYRVFAPSHKELGFSASAFTAAAPNDGEIWAYRAAGGALPTGEWWTRTPVRFGSSSRSAVTSNMGSVNSAPVDITIRATAAMVLPQSMPVNTDGTLVY